MRSLTKNSMQGSRSLVACAICAACLPASSEPAADRFAPLEYLAGHCWLARFEDGRADKQCYDWLFGGRFLRSVHVVDSDPIYEGITMFSWDPQAARLRFHYFTSAGGCQ
ncbi:hypothetical protein BH24PSE2_BH24PSE2_14290 [soil metagenome]